jgi:hypothetical protein
MKFSNVLLLASLSLGCAFASAQPAQDSQHSDGRQPGQQGQGPGGQERHRPPAEALAACKSLASGAACSFTSPRGAETGTCGAPEGKPLACRPQRGAGGGHPPMKDKPKN